MPDGPQSLFNDGLTRLSKAQVIGLLDNPDYRAWIKEELSERESYRRAKEEINLNFGKVVND